MITVQDIVQLPEFDSIRLAAPCADYLERPVVRAAILDHEPFSGEYDVFVPGEFVLTTLGFAQKDPELAEEAILKVLSRGVAALAIKPVAMKQLPEACARASQETGVPVFFYNGRYSEHVITAIMEAVAEDANNSQAQRIIGQLIAPSDEMAVRTALFTLAQMTGATFQAVAVRPRHEDEANVRAAGMVLEEILQSYRNRWPDVETVRAVRYRNTQLGLISYKRPPKELIAMSDPDLQRRMAEAGTLYCGISLEMPLGEGDLALRQALAALDWAVEQQETSVRWASMGMEAYRRAVAADRLMGGTARLMKGFLIQYDDLHEGWLFQTAQEFARNYGSISQTVAALYQHPNTVRYRLKRLKEVLGVESMSDRELATFLALTFFSP